MIQNIQDPVCQTNIYKINKCLGDIKDRTIVLGGDFNQNLDGVLDKSVYSKGYLQLTVHQLVGLVKMWR